MLESPRRSCLQCRIVRRLSEGERRYVVVRNWKRPSPQCVDVNAAEKWLCRERDAIGCASRAVVDVVNAGGIGVEDERRPSLAHTALFNLLGGCTCFHPGAPRRSVPLQLRLIHLSTANASKISCTDFADPGRCSWYATDTSRPPSRRHQP